MWFDSWSDLGRVLAVGTAGYVLLVLVLRVFGKRTLAKLNAFDFVVTVALGSILASLLLSKSVSWSEGALALVLLAGLQFAVALGGRLIPHGRDFVTARPTLLLQDGEPIESALNQQRVSLDEIRQVIRASGCGDLSRVAAVVLESDGTLSVIKADNYGDGSALHRVEGVDENDSPA